MKDKQNQKIKKIQFVICIIIVLLILICNYKELPNIINGIVEAEALPQQEQSETPVIDVESEEIVEELEEASKKQDGLILVDGRWTKGEGIIIKVLPDDTNPPCHQRLLIKISDDRTLLIAHNIDLAPRVKNPKRGDTITFYGEFIDNDKGGLIHWTHHDPDGGRGGYLIHKGQKYE